MSRAEAKAKVYRSVDELPEVLEPGKYIIGDAKLEVYEPTERELVRKMIKLARELREKGAEPI